MKNSHPDKAVIDHLGGPTKLARTLGLPQIGGVQRVANWGARGIPAAVRLQHMDLFAEAAKQVASIPKTRRKAA